MERIRVLRTDRDGFISARGFKVAKISLTLENGKIVDWEPKPSDRIEIAPESWGEEDESGESYM